MFIKKLVISSHDTVIRDMSFTKGINLIIDETPSHEEHATGNNVGKTTVLKLIDFCLGAKASIIYTDTESKKEVYNLVKDYLIDNEVMITLTLVDDIDDEFAEKIVIERNFLSRNKTIRRINGADILDKEYENELLILLFPDHKAEKPTLRQIISHNIRYKDESINNTLRMLNRFTTDVEYEALYLFLLGCTFDDGSKKQALSTKIKQEETYKARLEKKQTKTAYEIALGMIEDDIESLNQVKSKLNVNENFEDDLNSLNHVKYQINRSSSTISKLKIRKNLIEDSKLEMEKSLSNIDVSHLEMLYKEVNKNISGIQKSFEQLVEYHNKMLVEKTRFITEELPSLKQKIKHEENKVNGLLKQEKSLSEKIAKSDSFEELERILNELNEKFRLKGEYETVIKQIEDAEETITRLRDEITVLNDYLFSKDFEKVLQLQLKKFNKFFSEVSDEIYGEKYALKYDKVINKKKQQVYKFSSFNANMSSGKKQGEILCFDLAYLLFADDEPLSTLHFLLNDKKELMHDNQLRKVEEFIHNKDIQLIVSILKDKLPDEVLNKANTVVKLSQDSKLFKIEN